MENGSQHSHADTDAIVHRESAVFTGAGLPPVRNRVPNESCPFGKPAYVGRQAAAALYPPLPAGWIPTGWREKRTSALARSYPLCCAQHKGSYVEFRIMLSQGLRPCLRRSPDAVSWPRTLHNHKVARNARRSSEALNRAGAEPAGASLPIALSIIVRSASTYPWVVSTLS